MLFLEDVFVVTFTGPSPLEAHVEQIPDGTHKVTFHPTIAGKYTAHVSLTKPNNVLAPVGGSPFQIDIPAGPVYAQNCKATGKGLETGRVGEEGVFKISAFDKYLNPIRHGGDRFDVRITGPIAVTVSPFDCGDGSYNANYNITKSGPYKIAVSVNGAQIAASPFSVVLLEGDTHPSKTTLTFATADGKCGIVSSFIIHAHDVYGNERTKGGDKFTVSLALQNKPTSPKVVGEVKDNGNGTYNVSYMTTTCGAYQGEVVLDGFGHVVGSPFRVNMAPGMNQPFDTVVANFN